MSHTGARRQSQNPTCASSQANLTTPPFEHRASSTLLTTSSERHPMSFRDNLQHLRATRNMTQEQLAMLLGVSRQSVTKWEAEKSYPEMDKLLKMCDLFNCTLDDLVKGDLTSRPSEAPAAMPLGPAQDVCGYDEHMRKFARTIPTGIAFIILGVALGLLFDEKLPFFPSIMNSDSFAAVSVVVGVAIGLAFIIPAGIEHSAFVKAHPYIEDFYTEDDRASARKTFSRELMAGLTLILIGAIVVIAFDGTGFGLHATSALLTLAAIGVWLIVHSSMMFGRTNIDARNRNVVDELEMEDIMNAQIEQSHKEALLSAKRTNSKLSAICGVIMIVATIVGLLLLFGPLFSGQNIDDIDWASGSATYFWLAWPVGGMICGIVALLMNAFGSKE